MGYGYGSYDAYHRDGHYYWEKETPAPTPSSYNPPNPTPSTAPKPAPQPVPKPSDNTEAWRDKLSSAIKKDNLWNDPLKAAGVSEHHIKKINEHFEDMLNNHEG